jgi:hypothetical protein
MRGHREEMIGGEAGADGGRLRIWIRNWRGWHRGGLAQKGIRWMLIWIWTWSRGSEARGGRGVNGGKDGDGRILIKVRLFPQIFAKADFAELDDMLASRAPQA